MGWPTTWARRRASGYEEFGQPLARVRRPDALTGRRVVLRAIGGVLHAGEWHAFHPAYLGQRVGFHIHHLESLRS